jgi:beta-glucanase (GH16 family)
LAFNDEFNGTSLNMDKWFTRYIYDGGTRDHLNDEQQRYRDNNNHVIANGILSLVARKVSSNDPQGVNYESGMIRSDWTTRYGYIEARVKMPGGVGMWPAFWLNPDVSEAGAATWPPEIDIFEFVNNGVEDLPNMLHTGVVQLPGIPETYLYADPAFSKQWTFWWAPFKFTDDWHTISAEWTPTSVTTFVDGRKIMTRAYDWKDASAQLAGPAHILLNLAVGGSWAGRHGIDDSAMPESFQIDWVRAYKKL